MKKTALVLSGGGSRGAYEVGVWKALANLNINAGIVVGTSVGAINGAMYAQGQLSNAESLWLQLETDMVFDIEDDNPLSYTKEIIAHGGAGTSGLRKILELYLNEAVIRKSDIEYGLVTTEYPTLNGSYLFSDEIPQGQLIDYILASASCFPAVKKCTIGDKQYIDGGYKDNLPVKMAMNRGATDIIAVDLQAFGIVRKSTIEKAAEACDELHMIKSPLDLGNFLIFNKLNSKRLLELGYLDTMRHFGKYDGIRYTFEKGLFNDHKLAGADNAAYFLRLDPCCIYDKSSLMTSLKKAIASYKGSSANWMDYLDNAELQGHLLLYIAKSLKEDEENSIFMQPHLFKALMEEIQAANFLNSLNLV